MIRIAEVTELETYALDHWFANACARAFSSIVPLPALTACAIAEVIFWSSVPVNESSDHQLNAVRENCPVTVPPASGRYSPPPAPSAHATADTPVEVSAQSCPPESSQYG